MYLKMKSLAELEKLPNLYVDGFGDFWENEGAYDKWTARTDDSGVLCCCCFPVYFGEVLEYIEAYESDMPINTLMWGIDKVLTKETDPEYFL